MKRLAFLLTFLLLPSLAHAQFQHASFFNGGTTLTATCTNTTSTTLSQDYFEGTLQGNTTVTLPAAAIGCLSGDIIVLKPTAGASQTFTLTVSAGTGTAIKVPSNNGNTIVAPSGPASGATNNLNQIYIYNAVASTPQWELVTQEPQPPNNVNNLGSVTGAQTCNFALGPVCQITASAALTLTFSNLPTNALVWVVTGRNAANTSFNITWPSNAIAEVGSAGSDALGQMTGVWNTSASGAGSGPLFTVYQFWSDGTNAYLVHPINANFNVVSANTFSTLSTGGNGFVFSGDNAVHSTSRLPLSFQEGPDTSLSANESLGTFKTVKAITIENIELDIKTSPTCSVSEQITCFDCGTSAGACTSAQTSTIMSAVTIASGATRQSIDETVNTAAVAAGHYISCLITAGTCTVSNNAITMMARPQ